jgi:hypothetical protein
MGVDSVVIRFLVEEEGRREILRAVHIWPGVGLISATGGIWLTRDLVPSLIKGLSPFYTDITWLALAAGAASAVTR